LISARLVLILWKQRAARPSGKPNLMVALEVVTPVETGLQNFLKSLKTLDSGFRRNDRKRRFLTFYETIKPKKGA